MAVKHGAVVETGCALTTRASGAASHCSDTLASRQASVRAVKFRSTPSAVPLALLLPIEQEAQALHGTVRASKGSVILHEKGGPKGGGASSVGWPHDAAAAACICQMCAVGGAPGAAAAAHGQTANKGEAPAAMHAHARALPCRAQPSPKRHSLLCPPSPSPAPLQ